MVVTVCWSVVLIKGLRQIVQVLFSVLPLDQHRVIIGLVTVICSCFYLFSMGCLCLLPFVSMLRMCAWVGLFYYGAVTMTSALPYPLNSLGLLLLQYAY